MASRRVARRLSALVPHSIYLTRGKRSVDELIDYARTEGLRKIIFMNDYHGNPGEIRSISLGKNEWDWDKHYLKIQNITVSENKPRKPFDSYVAVKGKESNIFQDIFAMENEEDADIVFYGEADHFLFEREGKELLRAKIKIMSE